MAIASSPAGLMAQRYVEIYKETKKQHHVQCCVVSLWNKLVLQTRQVQYMDLSEYVKQQVLTWVCR